jgi:hypothetical protein
LFVPAAAARNAATARYFLPELVICQRQAANTLTSQIRHGIDDGRCDPGQTRLADPAHSGTTFDDPDFNIRHLIWAEEGIPIKIARLRLPFFIDQFFHQCLRHSERDGRLNLRLNHGRIDDLTGVNRDPDAVNPNRAAI